MHAWCFRSLRNLGMLTLQAVVLMALAFSQANAQSASDWKPVETALGRSGQPQPDGSFKFSLPRGDMKVSIGGTQVKPGLALGSWLAFKGTSDNGMVMGDLVLAESEVAPVMQKLHQGGIEVTALHNHLLNETPRVMYMHVSGHGSTQKLAQALHDAIALTKTPPPAPPGGAPAELGLDLTAIEQALGHQGKNNNGILQFAIPRAEKITAGGMEVPPSMGVATAINFQPLGAGRAAITGDFVLISSEVNPVIAALNAGGIQVTAIHSHMLDDQPHLFFMHFWATDDAAKLARDLKAALDKTNFGAQAPAQK
jgi:hypothetical protein